MTPSSTSRRTAATVTDSPHERHRLRARVIQRRPANPLGILEAELERLAAGSRRWTPSPYGLRPTPA
jgi:hypothetical protein